MNPVKIPIKFVWTQLIFRFFSEYSYAEQESKLQNLLKHIYAISELMMN